MKLLFVYLLYFIAISMFCNENIFYYNSLCLLSIFLGAAQQTYPPPDYSPPTYESSYCETNDDEYGRPYYSPYDNYHPPYSTYEPHRPTPSSILKSPSPTPKSLSPTPETSCPAPGTSCPTPGTSSPSPKPPVYGYQKRQTHEQADECHRTSGIHMHID